MKHQELRDASAKIQHSLPWSYAGCNTVEDSQGDEVAHPCDLSLAEPVAVIANGLSALLADADRADALEKALRRAARALAAASERHSAFIPDYVAVDRALRALSQGEQDASNQV